LVTGKALELATYNPQLVETIARLYDANDVFRHVFEQKDYFSNTPAARLHRKLSYSFPGADVETYGTRPDILDIKSGHNVSAEVAAQWERAARSLVEFTAMLVELYPDHELLFAARDARPYYDLARLMRQGDKQALDRLHIFTMSQEMGSNRDPHAADYLRQVFFRGEEPSPEKRYLFVDSTTFRGTTFDKVSSVFPPELRGNLGAHVVTSRHSNVPSSRMALLQMTGALGEEARDPFVDRMENEIPHYTNRSEGFLWEINGQRWDSYAKPGTARKREGTLRWLQFLRAFYERPDTQALVRARRELWRGARERIVKGDQVGLYRWLIERYELAPASDRKLMEAFVADVMDCARTNYAAAFGSIPFANDLRSLGTDALRHIRKDCEAMAGL
jgi:hypothetical protein